MKEGKLFVIGGAGGTADENKAVFTAPGMYYRGDWASGENYAPQNCVTVRAGGNQGFYLCITYIVDAQEQPGSSSTEGSYWIKMADLAVDPLAE